MDPSKVVSRTTVGCRDGTGPTANDREPFGKQRSGPSVSPSLVRHLNQIQLADRWCISARTLERWRWLGQGPHYLKIGGRVVYRLDDVEAYEAQQMRTSTASVAEVSPHAGRA